MKSIAAYRRLDKILIHPMSEDLDGVLRFQEPVTSFDRRDLNLDLLGSCIIESLHLARIGVPRPTDLSLKVLAPLLKAAGVKSYSKFDEAADMVRVFRDDSGTLVFEPWKNLGVQKGSTTVANAETRRPLATSYEVLGKELLEAFERCTRQ